MHRNHAPGGGALASLTANYTDSDASDSEKTSDEADSDEEGEEHHGQSADRVSLSTTGKLNHYHPSTSLNVNPAPFADSPSVLLSLVPTLDDSQQDILTLEDNTELGHITDEDQSDRSLVESEDETKDVLMYGSDVDDVQIPPEPAGRCANHLQEKFSQYYERMLREGLDLNATIQNQKQFRNPSIYEKLIQFCQIDELGTNYAPEVYDPGHFQNGPFYEDLAKAQKTEMDKRMKEHKDRTKIEFVTGTAKKTSSSSSSFDDEGKRRKSKWDVGATSVPTSASAAALPVASQSQPPGLVPVASVASGTKAMVISAFGTIAKKSKP